ncbi:MAG: hypothetical protein VYC34_01550 [Planctomycetota bacterium]|nr:hypothetical protein [Planctomycetota bacterium]
MKGTAFFTSVGAVVVLTSAATAQQDASSVQVAEVKTVATGEATPRGMMVVYEEDFEEGFADGSLHMQNGWLATMGGFAIGSPLAAEPEYGSKSVTLTTNVTGGPILAQSPMIGDPGPGRVTIEYQLHSQNDEFCISLSNSATGQVNTRYCVRPSGGITMLNSNSVQDVNGTYLALDDQPSNANAEFRGTLTIEVTDEGWVMLDVTVDGIGTVFRWLDVDISAALSPAAPRGFNFVRLETFAASPFRGSNSFTIDNVRVERPAPAPACAVVDFDGSGSVGAEDLAAVLGSWGACP